MRLLWQGGTYVLQLMDVYGGGTAVIFIAIAECISIVWIYGLKRFCDDVEFMLGKRPGWYWKSTWFFFAPLVMLLVVEKRSVLASQFIFVYSLIMHQPLHYEEYDYPDWADGIGWFLALISVAQIPIWAVIAVIRSPGATFKEKLLKSLRPTEDWGPSDLSCRDSWLEMVQANNYSSFGLTSIPSQQSFANSHHNLMSVQAM
ncbi:unnamed protein product [Darwinula stevensoni]|uniref:Sodium-dependent nutrient amino acid transporter 1 n=1 Tax=Darwinula stevensoni TaxID=69355 RepID=A0A7R8X7S4_9CRUS|nr:unnamed protein product [Darwinula stevensoni]CAG0887346.1 unnamed protein product [Darwinula stevensoni]